MSARLNICNLRQHRRNTSRLCATRLDAFNHASSATARPATYRAGKQIPWFGFLAWFLGQFSAPHLQKHVVLLDAGGRNAGSVLGPTSKGFFPTCAQICCAARALIFRTRAAWKCKSRVATRCPRHRARQRSRRLRAHIRQLIRRNLLLQRTHSARQPARGLSNPTFPALVDATRATCSVASLLAILTTTSCMR